MQRSRTDIPRRAIGERSPQASKASRRVTALLVSALTLQWPAAVAMEPASSARSGTAQAREARTSASPRIDWPGFFSRVSTSGAVFAPSLEALRGKRVRLRGYALQEPVPAGGVYLTRTPEGRLHPDDEETLPWDAVAVFWRPDVDVPQVPARPTVEGTLRLGNRRISGETVILVLEDAVPAAGTGDVTSN